MNKPRQRTASIAVSLEMMAELHRIAEKDRRPVGNLVKNILEDYINNLKKGKK